MNKFAPYSNHERARIVSFGGGKGGVGRSALCADVARSIGRGGSRILCVDVAPSCPTLYGSLNARELNISDWPQNQPSLGKKGAHIADFIQETSYNNIWFAAVSTAYSQPYRRFIMQPELFIAQLQELDFDWIFLDLPAGIDAFQMEIFVLSDVPSIVCTPEPSAIRVATQYLRNALYYALTYHPDAPDLPEQMIAFLESQPLNMTTDTLRGAAVAYQCESILDDALLGFEPYLIMNKVREGSEHDLGYVLAHAWNHALGNYPRAIASIDYQERRWFYHRRSAVGQSQRGEDLISKDIEQLGRTLLNLRSFEDKYPRPIIADETLHPALKMGMNPNAGRNDIRQHCRRLWEGYRRETSISLVFENPDRRLEISEELENIYRKVLTLPSESFTEREVARSTRTRSGNYLAITTPVPASELSKRRPFMTKPVGDPPLSEPNPVPDEIPDKSPSVDDASAPTETTIQSPNPGTFIANLRRQRNIGIHDLSKRTHIGVKYLNAIEQVDRAVLPRSVYLRGYLREIARVLETDSKTLIDQYFQYLSKP